MTRTRFAKNAIGKISSSRITLRATLWCPIKNKYSTPIALSENIEFKPEQASATIN